jgi:hypothetical protein
VRRMITGYVICGGWRSDRILSRPNVVVVVDAVGFVFFPFPFLVHVSDTYVLRFNRAFQFPYI